MSNIDMTQTPLSKIKTSDFASMKNRLDDNSRRTLYEILLNESCEITKLPTNGAVQNLDSIRIKDKEYYIGKLKTILKYVRMETWTKYDILYDAYRAQNTEDIELRKRIENFLEKGKPIEERIREMREKLGLCKVDEECMGE